MRRYKCIWTDDLAKDAEKTEQAGYMKITYDVTTRSFVKISKRWFDQPQGIRDMRKTERIH